MNAGASFPELDIAVSVEGGGWPQEAQLEPYVRRILETATGFLASGMGQPFPASGCEISLLFTDDEAMRRINGRWRSRETPTNVLSFPAIPVVPGSMPGPLLGDIVVAYETVIREAKDLEIPFDNHLTHLLVHGLLHLLGYDHMSDAEAQQMESLETRILAELHLSDPYEDSDPV